MITERIHSKMLDTAVAKRFEREMDALVDTYHDDLQFQDMRSPTTQRAFSATLKVLKAYGVFEVMNFFLTPILQAGTPPYRAFLGALHSHEAMTWPMSLGPEPSCTVPAPTWSSAPTNASSNEGGGGGALLLVLGGLAALATVFLS